MPSETYQQIVKFLLVAYANRQMPFSVTPFLQFILLVSLLENLADSLFEPVENRFCGSGQPPDDAIGIH